jgi:hypothetical protein
MGLFDFLSSETEQKNEYQGTNFAQSQNYDPRAANFGAHGADNYAAGKAQQAQAIDRRTAYQADYGQANQDRQLAMQAREGQQQAAGLMMNRATGAAPSIAGMQAQQDMNRAQAAQASAAASARGPAGLALAQQGAANNTANAQAQISGQAQVNAANERLQAEQAAFGAASGMRGQDYQSQAQAAGQAQFQTGMQMQNRGMNDARAMGYEQMGHQALGQEQQGLLQQQAMLAQSHGQTQQIAAANSAQNAETNKGLFNTMIGAGASAASAIGSMYSDARAKMGAMPLMDGGSGGMMSDVTSKVGLAQLGGFEGGPMRRRMLSGGAGPSDGATIGGTFHTGTSQIGADGGMDTMSGTKWNNRELAGMAKDPSGGLVARGGALAGAGQMLSDDRAKLRDAERQAYLLGRAHQMEGSKDFAYGGRPRDGEEIVDRDPWMSESRRGEVPAEWLSEYMNEGSSRAGLATGMSPHSDRAGGMMRRGSSVEEPREYRSKAGDFYAGQPAMSEMTGQLARGLAPYAYEYKPGFGTDGKKVGPMAQDMAANDVTATAVRKDPRSGLLSIDRDDGLKVALGGVGHLASKQAQQEQLIAELLADRGRPSRRY